jgi:hypothetical protein
MYNGGMELSQSQAKLIQSLVFAFMTVTGKILAD